MNESSWTFFLDVSERSIFMGVDCSSRAVHAVLVDEHEQVVGQGKWRSSETDFNDRFLEIMRKFSEDLSKINVIQKAAVESAIFIQNPKSTMEIATVVGGVRLICNQNGLVCTPVDNRHWKKQVLGKGNLNKQAIKAFTIEKWGDVFKEQDWSDAACVALWMKRRSDNG
tara:strand:- start:4828 stop:5334 length:507 start_codon:yes stop_codon:yes gene_type:complete